MDELSSLSRDDLVKLIRMHAKNWLAHDGCWFLAAEEKYGLDGAIDLDARACEGFSRTEARRIMKAFDLPEAGGLDTLDKALRLRLYATVNAQRIERPDDRTLRFKMLACRVQAARQRKGLTDFPCKPVGTVEYTSFAETIDPRMKTRCMQCPPDEVEDTGFVCGWEFTL